jgi:hypothetical protein
MINKLLNLSTKKLLIILFIILPIFSISVNFILAYFKLNFETNIPIDSQNSLTITTILLMFVSVVIEELFFRYDQSDEKIYKVFHKRLIYFLIFLILCRIFAVNNDLFIIFGFLVNGFFTVASVLKYFNTKNNTIIPIVADQLFYVSNLTFALLHLVKLEFNFITSNLNQLYFIVPYLMYLFILGSIMSVLRNRFKFGLTITIFLHFFFNLNLILIDFLLSKL